MKLALLFLTTFCTFISTSLSKEIELTDMPLPMTEDFTPIKESSGQAKFDQHCVILKLQASCHSLEKENFIYFAQTLAY